MYKFFKQRSSTSKVVNKIFFNYMLLSKFYLGSFLSLDADVDANNSL